MQIQVWCKKTFINFYEFIQKEIKCEVNNLVLFLCKTWMKRHPKTSRKRRGSYKSCQDANSEFIISLLPLSPLQSDCSPRIFFLSIFVWSSFFPPSPFTLNESRISSINKSFKLCDETMLIVFPYLMFLNSYCFIFRLVYFTLIVGTFQRWLSREIKTINWWKKHFFKSVKN